MRLNSLTFNSWIPDDKLRELIVPGEILKIERGAWILQLRIPAACYKTDPDPNSRVSRQIATLFTTWYRARISSQRAF